MNIFRNGKKGDEKEVLNLIGKVLSGYNLNLEPDGADFDVADIEKSYTNNGGWFQVVVNKGSVIGTVGIYKITNEECELRKMYLDPEYQGLGIGKELMNNALIAGKELGFKIITLQTNSLLNKALPLYDKYGFIQNTDVEVCSRCDIAMIRKL